MAIMPNIRNFISIYLLQKDLHKKNLFVSRDNLLGLKYVGKDFARPTNHHLLFPVFLNRAFTNCSVYKPAKISSFKLPGRTVCFLVSRTFFYSPTCFSASPVLCYSGDHEKHLPLRKKRNRPPSLFIAVNRLKGSSEQLGHLFLCLVQFLAKVVELFAVHGKLLRQ